MNAPTIIIGIVILAAFVAVVARGIYNKKHHKNSCSCGGACGNCPGSSMCHPEQ